MGAWGSGIYENDDALELVDDVTGGGGLEAIEDALRRVLDTGPEYLEIPEAAQGLAAADIVSRLQARNVPADTGVPALQAWLEEADFFAGAMTVGRARAAVERVMQKPSELMELWSETGSLDPGWIRNISLLMCRLG